MSIVLKDVPDDLRAQLEQEAAANFRSLDQEALARLQRSFEIEMNTARDQQWIDEALASGPATPLTQAEMDEVRDRVLGRKKAG
jgi:plasmid stability protein